MCDKIKHLSIVDKIIISAYKLNNIAHDSFSSEALVVEAWKNFPNTFGLAGFSDKKGKLRYPDSNKVYSVIMGSGAIRKKGFLKKIGKKMYKLTDLGSDYAECLLSKDLKQEKKKSDLPREFIDDIKRLTSHKVFEKYKNEEYSKITFHDACTFWGISPRSNASEFYVIINNFLNNLEKIINSISDESFTFVHGGRLYNRKEVMLLKEIHDFLFTEFQNEIEIIKSRTDER
ncbi:hypothetical protein HQ585_16025 [candidate division KSB1 bacterium]|nr:hypothetical protein [candidate division KSB1 bacterium]